MPSYVTPMRKTDCSSPDDCSLLRSNSIDLVGALVEYTHAARVGFQLTFSQSVAIGFSGAGAVPVQQRSSGKSRNTGKAGNAGTHCNVLECVAAVAQLYTQQQQQQSYA